MGDEEDCRKNNIILRNYQTTLVDICSKSNSIIFLPTGSGKTEIAIQIIKNVGEKIEGKFDDGAKRVLFTAPTRHLVFQHAGSLKEKTAFKVGSFTGEDGVDFWSDSKWLEVFSEHQILIMTPAIIENVLSTNIVGLDIFALIIFDECHNGVADHCYRQVMRNMQTVPVGKQPLILGLTATLLNTAPSSALAKELEVLEATFHAKIATCDELSEVLQHSARPEIVPIIYNNTHASFDFLKYLKHTLQYFEYMDTINWEVKRLSTLPGFTFDKKKPHFNTFKRIIDDINEALEELGVYPASLVALYHLLIWNLKGLRAPDENSRIIISLLVNLLHQIRSHFMHRMDDDDRNLENILKFCSDKVIQLLNLLKEGETSSTMIFTQRRSRAVVLAHILRIVSSQPNSPFTHIKSTVCVGNDCNPNNLFETILESKWRRKAINEFSLKKKNVMVATSVLEEGIDLPDCNCVIRFDSVLNYRSFIQCKGRARSKNGKFFFLVNKGEMSVKLNNIRQYEEIEKILFELLVGRNSLRTPPTQDFINMVLYDEDVEPFYPKGHGGPHVSGVMAIQLVAQYCAMLDQDSFSSLSPEYFYKYEGGKVMAGVKLPVMSPVRHAVVGKPMPNKKLAKRSAFLETVKALYYKGVLTEELKPATLELDNVEYEWLFPHYRQDDLEEKHLIGTKKRRQIYDIQYPPALTACTAVADKRCYLHVLTVTPNFAEPSSNRSKGFHKLLSSSSNYAILSSKEMPSICDFPLYIRLGEIMCHLKNNAKVLHLTLQQLNAVTLFHFHLFSSVINCGKEFLIMDKSKVGNDFFIVPVNNKTCEILWDVVNNIETLCFKAPVVDGKLVVNKETYKNTIVSPFYRLNTSDVELYIVTEVCPEITPRSQFPGNVNETYMSYYKDKYNETISNPTQALLEVKRLPTIRSSFIHPRTPVSIGLKSRRKMMTDGDDFDEMLVAELCDRYEYPSDLWLQAVFLPTMLHRVVQFASLLDLESKLRKELNWQPRALKWARLSPTTMQDSTSTPTNSTKPGISCGLNKNKTPAAALYTEKKEPLQIMNCMEKVADCDLKYFNEYITAATLVTDAVKQGDKIKNYDNFLRPEPTTILPLTVIKEKETDESGPELHTLLAAFTAKSANDVLNLERLETFGDSFLKFMTSYFLFRQFPKQGEGFLTAVKGRLISNRNLLYCGQARGLHHLVQAQEFVANGDWVPPMFQVPQEILNQIKLKSRNPSCIHSFYLTVSEQISGKVSPKSMATMLAEINETDVISEEALSTRSLSYLQQKSLSDKGIADAVEALIGAYVLSGGLEVGLKLLKWLGVLQSRVQCEIRPEDLLRTAAPSSKFKDVKNTEILKMLERCRYRALEETLNYSFKDKSYLLQAVTHPTDSFQRYTLSYQRLEFLGDAVLDFLVTSFLYQEGPELNPGQLTQLRSSLVNNITFGSFCVKYGLHRHLLSMSSSLSDAIASFVDHQSSQNYFVDESVYLLVEEKDLAAGASIEVPKALGDLFEALAGAVFLDSGNSFEAVWRVFYPLMKQELHGFMKKIPRNSISLLYELTKNTSFTTYKIDDSTVRARVDVRTPSGEMVSAFGFGRNKSEAKRSSAKLALKIFMASES